MEKRNAHHLLARIKELIEEESYRFTRTARQSIYGSLEMELSEALEVILSLTNAEFYKSMTTYQDHTRWQDVYHAKWLDLQLYIKLQIEDDETVIISFKEKEEW